MPSDEAKGDAIHPLTMTIADIMKANVTSIGMDETLKRAQELFIKHRIRHLPVLDEQGTLVGMISDRDLKGHISPRLGTVAENASDRATLDRRVHTIMAHNVVTGMPEMSVAFAAKRMLEERLGCLPILNIDNQVIGMVSTSDFLALLASAIPKS